METKTLTFGKLFEILEFAKSAGITIANVELQNRVTIDVSEDCGVRYVLYHHNKQTPIADNLFVLKLIKSRLVGGGITESILFDTQIRFEVEK